MDFKALLDQNVQDFINQNQSNDISKLAFQKNPFPEIEYSHVLNQIVAKHKAKEKLPLWFNTKNIIYPEKISIEQTSSEKTANFKASLIQGNDLIDLSGGFGIDDYYFAQKFQNVVHCEINPVLSEIVKHNYTQLGTLNIICKTGESATILKQLNQKFDWIYVDPSRRNDKKGKVFLLNDCEPNVPNLLDFYFQYSQNILVKTAPILDITSGINELQYVKKIHIVALENEVKELLWEIEQNFSGKIELNAVNIGKNNTTTDLFLLENEYSGSFSTPIKYIYEPNASIMKSGQFNAICERYKVFKLHQHSHLYTNNKLIDFPGRCFEIIEQLPFQKDSIKKHIQNQKMNVATRNFPLKPEELKKKYKINDGGAIFAFFTTDIKNNKIILLCKKAHE